MSLVYFSLSKVCVKKGNLLRRKSNSNVLKQHKEKKEWNENPFKNSFIHLKNFSSFFFFCCNFLISPASGKKSWVHSEDTEKGKNNSGKVCIYLHFEKKSLVCSNLKHESKRCFHEKFYEKLQLLGWFYSCTWQFIRSC